MIGSNPLVYTGKDHFYVADHFESKKIYRVDDKGALINVIGCTRKGFDEYLTFSDFDVDETEKQVFIYSGADSKKYTYSLEGKFIKKEDLEQPFYKAKNSKNGTWLYLGYANMYNKGRVVKVDTNKNITADMLESKYNVMSMDEITPTFFRNADDVYLRETTNNVVYKLNDDDIYPLYDFNFDKYAISKEYYNQLSITESIECLLNSDFAAIKKFMQNDDYALVEVFVQRTNGKHTTEIGVKDIKNNIWKWFNIDASEESKELLKNGVSYLTDKNEVLFVVDSYAIIDYAGKNIFSNAEIISSITKDDNPIIIKCKL